MEMKYVTGPRLRRQPGLGRGLLPLHINLGVDANQRDGAHAHTNRMTGC